MHLEREKEKERKKDPAPSLKHYSCSLQKVEFISRRKWIIAKNCGYVEILFSVAIIARTVTHKKQW